jgi:hypothetical protein
MRDKTLQGEDGSEIIEAEAVEVDSPVDTTAGESEEMAIDHGEVEGTAEEPRGEAIATGDPTAEGYDQAVEDGAPFIAEAEINAHYSADPVALTEAEPFSEDELILQEAGRDLRPDTVVPSPDITSSDAAVLESLSEIVDDERLADEFAMNEDRASQESEAPTSAPAVLDEAASSESTDEEKQDASPDAAN